MKKHAPFIVMTLAAFVLLFAAISRGDDPSPFLDASPDALPDAVVSESLPVAKEVILSVVPVTPSVQPDCADGLCRVARRSDADTNSIVATSDTGTRFFRSRPGILRRFRRR